MYYDAFETKKAKKFGQFKKCLYFCTAFERDKKRCFSQYQNTRRGG